MNEKRAFIQKRDLFILLVLLAAALGIWYWYAKKPSGAAAVVSFADKREQMQIFLSENKTYTFVGDNEIPVTLKVQDGSIQFVDSQCPDHICEGVGKLSSQGQSAVCMPAGVSVTIS